MFLDEPQFSQLKTKPVPNNHSDKKVDGATSVILFESSFMYPTGPLQLKKKYQLDKGMTKDEKGMTKLRHY